MKSVLNRLREIQRNVPVGRTLRLVWREAPQLTVVVILLLLVEMVFLFSSLYAVKMLIDAVTRFAPNLRENAHELFTYVFKAAFFTVAYHVVKSISSYYSEKQAVLVSEHIDMLLHEKTVELDISYFEDPNYFDYLQRAKSAGSERPTAMIIAMLNAAKQGASMLAIGSIVVSINWVLLPLLMLFIIPLLYFRILYANKLNEFRVRNTSAERESVYYSQLITTETPAKEMRVYDLGHHFKNKYLGIRGFLAGERLRISRSRTINEMLAYVLVSIGLFSCLSFILSDVASGEVSVGNFSIFLIIFPQIFGLLQGMSTEISSVYHNSIFVKSIYEMLDIPVRLQKVNKQTMGEIVAQPLSLTLSNVSFHYPHVNKLSLNNVSLTVSEGKMIALVGMNGAGKSTLIKILTRLYEPTAGQMTLNGTDVSCFDTKDYQKLVSVVFQDFCRFNVSVRENISMGRLGSSDRSSDNLYRAAADAGAESFIRSIPAGYDGIMGRIFEGGTEVSIGQWQKLAIARAFYRGGRILILDEATSALDADAEKKFFESLDRYRTHRSIVLISHRYSALKNADYLYVLNEGSIVEEGTHDELIKRRGSFFKLFNEELADEYLV